MSNKKLKELTAEISHCSYMVEYYRSINEPTWLVYKRFVLVFEQRKADLLNTMWR